MKLSHEQDLKSAARKILTIARENFVEALRGMEDLKDLVEAQQHRIDTLTKVISELEVFEED